MSLNSCRSIVQGKRFAECEFRTTTVDNFRLAGVNVLGIKDLSELTLLDAGNVTASLLQGRLPLTFTLNVEVMNPNEKKAAINTMDWILLIDDSEITSGTTNQRIEVPPNGGITNMPLHFDLELTDIFQKETGNALINLALGLVNKNKEPSRIAIRVKPSFMIAGGEVKYPGYITVSKKFKSEK